MKRTSLSAKLAKKRGQLALRTATVLAVTNDEAVSLLSLKRQQSIRINSLLGDTSSLLDDMRALGWQGEQYEWMKEGFSIEEGFEALRDSSLTSKGNILIQNAASWLPVLALDPQPRETILDMCAAPGGKTTHIAALAKNQASITANDNSRPRQAKLRAMCARLDAHIERFTLYDGQFLARKLEDETFDKILLDAPCSGEGLINFASDKDILTWSVAHIKRLQQLQKRLISQAWQLLKPGGTLVYSTCTIAPEENEAVVDYAMRSFEDAKLIHLTTKFANRVPAVAAWNGKTFNPAVKGCIRLQPSSQLEAFFVCKLVKQESLAPY